MDGTNGSLVPVLMLYLLFLLAEGAMFGFGAAIQNLNDAELLHAPADEGRKQRIRKIMDQPGAFIESTQILTFLGGLVFGLLLTPPLSGAFGRLLAERLPGGAGSLAGILAALLSALLLVLLTLTFGIDLPKRLAERKSVPWALGCLGPVRLLMALLLPLRLPVRLVCRPLMRLLGIDPDLQTENVTEEDIMSMVTEGHEQGVVETDEAEMINNIFELNDKQASDVMIHRKNIIGIDGDTPLKDAVTFILTEGRNSRFPVYRENIDNCLGILHMKDAMIRFHSGKYNDRKLCEIPGLIRKALFIPETRALDTLFQEMQSSKIHMVIVVDEYGQTAGIVTMEDILEEIVGNIVDEYDREEELITPLPDGAFLMRGTVPLAEAGEAAGIPFSEEEENEFDTLNGFLIASLDRIPADGEKPVVKARGFLFRIQNAQNNMIRTVRVEKETKPEDAGEEA